jgi:hypothetical protein
MSVPLSPRNVKTACAIYGHRPQEDREVFRQLDGLGTELIISIILMHELPIYIARTAFQGLEYIFGGKRRNV